MTSLRCENLDIAVPGRDLVNGLSMTASAGHFLGILGKNGAGKTTTLHILAGLATADRGSILLDERPMRDWTRREVALNLGLLMQNYEDPFSSTVMETVLIGRHPHLGFWQWEDEEDRELAREALRMLAMDDLESRAVDTLSGGERRRLAVATVLAQDPTVFLLDEPTNHLDPQYVRDVLTLFRRHADNGRTVIASLHDVNAAARYCDRCLLLFGDGRWLEGPADEVLTEDNLEALYGIEFRRLEWQDRPVFVAA
jgi:iron complex transport system ATP-binding protein